jgi:hypothetical protein
VTRPPRRGVVHSRGTIHSRLRTLRAGVWPARSIGFGADVPDVPNVPSAAAPSRTRPRPVRSGAPRDG